MSKAEELIAQARAKRELAQRAIGLSDGLFDAADRARLLGHARQLEAEAQELERQVTLPDEIPPMPTKKIVQEQAETPLADNENEKTKA